MSHYATLECTSIYVACDDCSLQYFKYYVLYLLNIMPVSYFVRHEKYVPLIRSKYYILYYAGSYRLVTQRKTNLFNIYIYI